MQRWLRFLPNLSHDQKPQIWSTASLKASSFKRSLLCRDPINVVSTFSNLDCDGADCRLSSRDFAPRTWANRLFVAFALHFNYIMVGSDELHNEESTCGRSGLMSNVGESCLEVKTKAKTGLHHGGNLWKIMHLPSGSWRGNSANLSDYAAAELIITSESVVAVPCASFVY